MIAAESTEVSLDWSPYLLEKKAAPLEEEAKKAMLSNVAAAMRLNTMEMMVAANYGHPASSLGLADLFTALYFGDIMRYSTTTMFKSLDRIVISCGHISAIVYTALAMAGYFEKEKLPRYACKEGLPGHLCRMDPYGVDVSTGSLGQGVSMAVGMAMALKKEDRNVFLITSDGEQQEGQVWEAYLAAKKFNLSNLITFVDCNGIQNSGTTAEIMPVGDLARKYRSFGLSVIERDGHDMMGIIRAVQHVRKTKEPSIILLKTIPCKGVSFMENNAKWHGDLPEGALLDQALMELEQEFKKSESWQTFIKEMV